MELMQDLNRIEQMDQLIRKTLGPELQLSSNDIQINQPITERKGFAVSYVGNIPSHYPVDGFITQKVKVKNIYKDQNHYGIDIAVKEGEPIYAVASGFVVFSGWTYNFGNYIVLYHGDDYFSIYGHNKINYIDTREFVNRGDIIGEAGGTGISSGPHLHFEIWKNGEPINPFDLFPKYISKDISVDNYE
jgi:murein DD-endopeptidase MepM/ murein hydrolase activator NlpD